MGEVLALIFCWFAGSLSLLGSFILLLLRGLLLQKWYDFPPGWWHIGILAGVAVALFCVFLMEIRALLTSIGW